MREIFPSKKIVISEAGWATTASEFGERASEEKQNQSTPGDSGRPAIE